ncbi:hypothetical protein QYE76_006617 [Lolium multiflorum]|uniref:Uncharacterized protein n=1 Tax=Lolium multiflorum TaxID=4521 RepID=A0AAD8RWM7_LOLMU|nr:hypothetical protein QYE76_006617 [Lolium multiflorum]
MVSNNKDKGPWKEEMDERINKEKEKIASAKGEWETTKSKPILVGSVNTGRSFSHNLQGALPPALDLDSFPCVEEAIRVADEFCDQYRALKREVEILQEENQRLRRMLEYYSNPSTRPSPPHSDNNESLQMTEGARRGRRGDPRWAQTTGGAAHGAGTLGGGGPRPLSPPFLRVLLRPENLSHRGNLTKSYSRLCGAENTREKRALRRAGIRRGNSLPEGEIDAIAIVIELDIISIIIIIISTIYTAITTAAPRHRCNNLAAGGTFMSITLGAATKLLDDMMINYSEWHTERAPQGKKVNSVEETSSLSDKIDVIMSMLVNGRSNVDPNNVPLASLVAQEENVDVNFIKNNNFNNNAYRNNSGNNYRPYPSANGNGYGNSYGNSYNNNRSVPSGLEAMLKEFISTQTAFNKSVEEKLDKIDIIASRVDRLASDVNLLKLKVMPNEDIDNKITTTANAIQVRINENIRLMAELRARWDREENEKLAKENNVAKVWTITTTSNVNSSHVAAPPTINGKIIGVGNVSTPSAKRTKLPEIAKTAETACDKTAEIFSNLGNNDPIAVAHNDLDFDDCHISEVIKFLQKLAKSPNASAINLAFTKYITNALIKAREEKLKLETSIPRKLEDGWEPIIKMKFNDFECNALCDLGASISVMPKKIYDMLDLPPLKNCYLDVNLADNVKKKPLGRIDNVRITVNNNLVPVDFVVLDIECNASCPIVLGRPFLRTVGAVIDMREGNIKYQFTLKKGMEHFPRKRMKLPFDSIIRTSYDVDASTLDVT